MPESLTSARPTTVRIVLTTAGSPVEASRIGRTLVAEKLVACATLIPSAESIYEWQGKTEVASETLMLLKTDAEHLAALEERLYALHSYETPEFLVLSVDAGSAGYLAWMQSVLGAHIAE